MICSLLTNQKEAIQKSESKPIHNCLAIFCILDGSVDPFEGSYSVKRKRQKTYFKISCFVRESNSLSKPRSKEFTDVSGVDDLLSYS